MEARNLFLRFEALARPRLPSRAACFAQWPSAPLRLRSAWPQGTESGLNARAVWPGRSYEQKGKVNIVEGSNTQHTTAGGCALVGGNSCVMVQGCNARVRYPL